MVLSIPTIQIIFKQIYLAHSSDPNACSTGQNGTGSNDNEGVLYILQRRRSEASPLNAI